MILKIRLILDGEGPSKHNTLGGIKEKVITFDYQKKKNTFYRENQLQPWQTRKKVFNKNSNK